MWTSSFWIHTLQDLHLFVTTAWVIPSSHKRRGEACWSCAIGSQINSHVSNVLLVFCLCGMPYMGPKCTWHSFCSPIVVRPHSKTADLRISIQKGNKVARPLCQLFSLWRGIEFNQKWMSCGATSPRDYSLDRKRKVWQKSLFQWNFFSYLNRSIGNWCKIMIKFTK